MHATYPLRHASTISITRCSCWLMMLTACGLNCEWSRTAGCISISLLLDIYINGYKGLVTQHVCASKRRVYVGENLFFQASTAVDVHIFAHTHTPTPTHTHLQALLSQSSSSLYCLLEIVLCIQCALFQITFGTRAAVWPYHLISLVAPSMRQPQAFCALNVCEPLTSCSILTCI